MRPAKSPFSGLHEASMGRILAVASGKGGVGKTWLAISLSHALARAGQRVLLFDGDLGLANVDIQLGLTPTGDLGDVVSGRLTTEQAIFTHVGGFDILAGRSGSATLASIAPGVLEDLLAALRRLSRRYDSVVVDLGAGIDRSVRRIATFADLLLVVATDEPTSLTDAYAVLKLHACDRHCSGGEPLIVVNQAASRQAGERTYGALLHGHAPHSSAMRPHAAAPSGATNMCEKHCDGKRCC